MALRYLLYALIVGFTPYGSSKILYLRYGIAKLYHVVDRRIYHAELLCRYVLDPGYPCLVDDLTLQRVDLCMEVFVFSLKNVVLVLDDRGV